jgi:hypothetical protein
VQLVPKELKVLGQIIDEKGIRMDPNKVDSIVNWKVPTSKELVQGFLGAVGFLADDVAEVRVSMGVLHSLTGSTAIFRWLETHQCAFDEIKAHVAHFWEHRHVPLRYGENTDPIHLITDACTTGIAGVISQGPDWRNSNVAAFFSAKLNPAQQNYPVHKLEMFAGVETMKQYSDILLGVPFKWYTDHRPLEHLLKQKTLSGRQARWIEALSEFNFEIVYIEGVNNILSDALSRLYSNDAAGTVRSPMEYTQYDEDYPAEYLSTLGISLPLFVGVEANALTTRSKSGARPAWILKPKRLYNRRPKTLEEAPTESEVIPATTDSEPVWEAMVEGRSVDTHNTSSPTVNEVEGGKETKSTLNDVLEVDSSESDKSKHPEAINLDGLIEVVES